MLQTNYSSAAVYRTANILLSHRFKQTTMKSIVTLLIAALPLLACAQVENGLIMHYNFEGQVTDQSPAGNNGTPNDLAYGPDRFANPTHAGDFTGDTAAVIMPDSLLWKHDTMTISCWFNTTTAGALIGYQNAPFMTPTNNLVPIGYVDVNGYVRGTVWNSTITMTDSIAYNDSTWHHWALVVEDNEQRMYVDGNLSGTKAGDHTPLSMFGNQIGWALQSGSWTGSTSNFFFNGYIDDFRIHNRPLSVAEIDSLINEADPDTTTNPGTFVPHVAAQSEVLVYPNPSSGQFQADVSRLGAGTKQVLLINNIGQVVACKQNSNDFIRFDGNDLPQGIYLLVVQGHGKQHVSRVVIQ